MNGKVSTNLKWVVLLIGIALGLLGLARAVSGSNIDPTDKYAWSTNVGWVNFRPTQGGVTVYSDHLEGYAWAENIGWIRLGTHTGGGAHTYANTTNTDYGVNIDGSWALSGYAWSTSAGWIDFNPNYGGVTIDPASGSFDGYALGENIGWIHFKNTSPAYGVSVVQSNQAPYVPGNPTPPDGASDIPTNQTLSWEGDDPDSDPVTYTVALGTADPPPVVTTDVTTTTYNPGKLDTNTAYYWIITATDGISVAVGPTWRFTTAVTTAPNQAPYTPNNPIPANEASDVPTNQVLSWESGDPDSDPVTYTVAFGTSPAPSIVATDVITPSYSPGMLDTGTTYYWAITATDGLSVTVGPAWSFTTTLAHPVDTGYEPNDTCAQAYPIPTDGTVQIHAFQDEGDEDWVSFQATAGVTYVIEVRTPPASTADVRLEVYDSCDPGGSFDEDDPPLNPDIRLAFEAPTSGTYYLHLTNNSPLYGPDAVYHLSVRALQDILPSGAVIIVAGRLREDDPLQANIHYVTDAAYDLALTHGCAVTQVTYLATDTSLPGVTGRATVENLEEAITQWAVDKVGPYRPLTLYLMDHGNYDLFYLDKPEGHQLTPIDLDDWLEQLENAVAGVKVNVVIEACYSGSFIDQVKSVSGPGRVVIASTSNAARAYASQDGATFSDSFFNVMKQGMTLGLSFYEGMWAAMQGHPDQEPWLDDDGDGVANEAEDGKAAARRTLACGVFPPELNWPPHISQAEVRDLDGGLGEVWAKVQDDERVKFVWAVVYPPSYQTPAPGEEMIREPLPITLKHQGEGWYGGTEQFDETGEYRVVVYAEDYEALRARPLEIKARTGWAVYLPLVVRRD